MPSAAPRRFVIGGRVLDVTAVVGFSTGQSVYAEALAMTAIEENIVLAVPSAVLVRVSALIPRGHELGLDVLLGLPCTIVDPLDTVLARAVGTVPLGAVFRCAIGQRYPVVSGGLPASWTSTM